MSLEGHSDERACATPVGQWGGWGVGWQPCSSSLGSVPSASGDRACRKERCKAERKELAECKAQLARERFNSSRGSGSGRRASDADAASRVGELETQLTTARDEMQKALNARNRADRDNVRLTQELKAVQARLEEANVRCGVLEVCVNSNEAQAAARSRTEAREAAERKRLLAAAEREKATAAAREEQVRLKAIRQAAQAAEQVRKAKQVATDAAARAKQSRQAEISARSQARHDAQELKEKAKDAARAQIQAEVAAARAEGAAARDRAQGDKARAQAEKETAAAHRKVEAMQRKTQAELTRAQNQAARVILSAQQAADADVQTAAQEAREARAAEERAVSQLQTVREGLEAAQAQMAAAAEELAAAKAGSVGERAELLQACSKASYENMLLARKLERARARIDSKGVQERMAKSRSHEDWAALSRDAERKAAQRERVAFRQIMTSHSWRIGDIAAVLDQLGLIPSLLDTPSLQAGVTTVVSTAMDKLEKEFFGEKLALFLRYEMRLTYEDIRRITQAAGHEYSHKLDRYVRKIAWYNRYNKSQACTDRRPAGRATLYANP